MEGSSSYSTLRAFKPHFHALAKIGYFKLVNTQCSPTKRMLHNWYRVFIWLVILTFNLQYGVQVIQTRHDTDRMVDALYILLTTLNTLGKQVAFNARIVRLDRIIRVINGSHFAPKNNEHVKMLKENERAMEKLVCFFQTMASIACIFFATAPAVNMVMGQEVHVNGYFPFDTNNSPVFEVALWYLSLILLLQAWGNVTMDCTIVGFYSMAKTQLKVLRYNLEHLVAPRSGVEVKPKICPPYEDSEIVQKRLEYCVQHHLQISWFVKEVESIFCEAMAVQFLLMAWVICITVYKIVGITSFSAEFSTLIIYLNCMLSQLFIYCYFGSQVKVESEFVAQSVYCSEWTQLSPSFRRQLLVLMQCSARPITPCAAKIVPISLDTYIAVLRASYTLFAILDEK